MFAADQERWSAQSNPRYSPIVRFIWHHQAGTSDDGTIGAMMSGSRQVSATWTIDNKAPVGAGLRDYARITAVVPEDRRPWTSASRADDGALTVEMANSSGPPDYGIADASVRAAARLAAYALRAYGVPLQRATEANGWRGHMGHNEVVGAFGDGYATACPLHLDIDRILELAGGDGIDGGALQPTTPKDDSMSAAEVAELKADVKALGERVAKAERPFLFVVNTRTSEAWMVRAAGGHVEKLAGNEDIDYLRGAGYADTVLSFGTDAEAAAALGRFA